MKRLGVYRVWSGLRASPHGVNVVARSPKAAIAEAKKSKKIPHLNLSVRQLHYATKEEIIQACLKRLVR